MNAATVRIPRRLALAVVVGCAGCRRGRAADLVEVRGVVRRQGSPLAGATVLFVATPPHEAPLAYGAVAADGRYRMLSANRYPGVLPGRYAVCVTVAGVNEDGGADPLLPRSRPALVPGEYSDAAKTPLQFDVPPEG